MNPTKGVAGGVDVLLPCPFCGAEPEVYPANRERSVWNACCGNPGCVTRGDNDFLSEADAVAAWNRRAFHGSGPATGGECKHPRINMQMGYCADCGADLAATPAGGGDLPELQAWVERELEQAERQWINAFHVRYNEGDDVPSMEHFRALWIAERLASAPARVGDGDEAAAKEALTLLQMIRGHQYGLRGFGDGSLQRGRNLTDAERRTICRALELAAAPAQEPQP